MSLLEARMYLLDNIFQIEFDALGNVISEKTESFVFLSGDESIKEKPNDVHYKCIAMFCIQCKVLCTVFHSQ